MQRKSNICALAIIMAVNITVVALLTYILMASVETDLRPYLLQKSHRNAARHSPTITNNSSAFDELYRRGYDHGHSGFQDDVSLFVLAFALVMIFLMEGTNLFSKVPKLLWWPGAGEYTGCYIGT